MSCQRGFCSLVLGSLIHSAAVSAVEVEWSHTELQALQGRHFELGAAQRTLLTLEHADVWTYGVNFGFLDFTEPFGHSGETDTYGEVYSWLSYEKVMGHDFGTGLFDDIRLGGGMQADDAEFRAYLYGTTLSFNLPGFDFFTLDLFAFDDQADSELTYAVTPSWRYPFKLGSQRFLFRGFVTFTGAHGAAARQVSAQPQLLWDVGAAVWGQEDKLLMGLEYQHYRNKYGVAEVNEHNPEIMLSYTF